MNDDDSVDEPYRLKGVYEWLKAVRTFDPLVAREGKVTLAKVDELAVISGITPDIICKLHHELPEYVLAAKNTDMDLCHYDLHNFTENALRFWRELSGFKCPTWRQQARRVMILTPSCAAPARVFAMLERMFNATQESSLSDVIEASLMWSYNGREVW